MALSVKKLRFPKELAVTDYKVMLHKSGISEEGEPLIAFIHKGRCIFSEKAKRILTPDGKQITLLGKIIIEGDIAPNLKDVSSGVIEINGFSYEIYSGARSRNPDGSIFSTNWEIM